jgi:hypothetical protein
MEQTSDDIIMSLIKDTGLLRRYAPRNDGLKLAQ